MGNCFGSAPFFHPVKDRNSMKLDSENRAGTSSERSNGPTRKGRGSPKRSAERDETRLKSTSPGDTAEHPSVRSEMAPAKKKARKPNRRGGHGKAAMNSVPTTSSASPPKKAKKEEPADSKRKDPVPSPPPRKASPKEAWPVAEGVPGVAKGDSKRGGGKGSRKAKLAGASDVEANKEVENMEVTIQPETQAKTHQEPPVQGVPPPTEVKAETLPDRADAVVVVEAEEEAEEAEEAVEEEDDDDDGEEDIYRSEAEIDLDEKNKKGQPLQQTLQDRAGAKDSSSVEAEVNLLSYSQKEWRGNTAKSALIRKGYEEVSQSFVGLRRVRGDNYCALRATLFQVFAQSTELPSWLREEAVTLWPEQLLVEMEQIGQWRFPMENQEEHAPEGAIEQLKHYMGLLRKRWEAVAQADSAQERRGVCEEVFRAKDEEYGLLEVVKFLMLRTATELHERMQRGDDVPVFCYLLFARDDSSSPRAFLSNHLSHVGFSGGLEQVEMFLLGYALQQTIKVYRLYKAGTEEFVTYYPDDHEEWPCVCLVTEDDRHYNVPVSEAERLQVPESPTPD